jgi:hypothetical protein
MNKTQLIEQLKKPVDQIDSLLKAAGIGTELEIYIDDHLKTLQALDEMVASGKTKTYKEAAKLYRQQQAHSTTTTSESVVEVSERDELILTLANQAADATLANFPQIAIEEYQRLKALFVQRYRQRLAEQLQNPEFRQQFQAAIEGKEVGKFNLLNNTTSNIALPSNSSSSS